MQKILECCAGIDVHKKTAVVCIMTDNGTDVKKQFKTFSTMTKSLRSLGEWLVENNVQQVAIESTGVYWIPVFNILEIEFGVKIVLANPYHVKNVPGRKTDIRDSEWLCNLLKHGLIQSSFIPPAPIRNLRTLKSLRAGFVEMKTEIKNRITKNLECCNIKLSSILSSIFGVSGRKIIWAIINGELNPVQLANLADHGIKASKDELIAALTGTIQEVDKFVLSLLMRNLESLEQSIKQVEQEILRYSQPFTAEIALIEEIPGISFNIATTVISEIGIDMNKFPTEDHLASWVGVAPGNNESAGIVKSARIRKGNIYLKSQLVQAALAAIKVKNSYFHTCYHRLKAKIGSKKAIIAIVRKLVICIYLVLLRKKRYYDLGANYVDKNAQAKKIKYHAKKILDSGLPIPPELQELLAELI
jgi:transposase